MGPPAAAGFHVVAVRWVPRHSPKDLRYNEFRLLKYQLARQCARRQPQISWPAIG